MSFLFKSKKNQANNAGPQRPPSAAAANTAPPAVAAVAAAAPPPGAPNGSNSSLGTNGPAPLPPSSAASNREIVNGPLTNGPATAGSTGAGAGTPSPEHALSQSASDREAPLVKVCYKSDEMD
jgi:hypothetical protein